YLHSSRTYLFFFYSYANHRALHSFPTRRSSDLFQRQRQTRDESAAHTDGRSERPDVRRHGPRHAAWNTRDASRWGRGHCDGGVRSEEHTSELQSRGHLVCRLLLEKKKNKKKKNI